MNVPGGPAVGGGLGQQEKQHLFRLVLQGLEQNWNPRGWQAELKAAERASTIIHMYASPFPRLLSFFHTPLSRYVVPVSALSQVMVGGSSFGGAVWGRVLSFSMTSPQP